jgi:predicted negative regulator of RcsB-dependent stress response
MTRYTTVCSGLILVYAVCFAWRWQTTDRLSSLCLTTTPKLTWRLIPQFIIGIVVGVFGYSYYELRY